MGNKAILKKGLGIKGCTARDRKNKVKIDKVRGWGENERKINGRAEKGKQKWRSRIVWKTVEKLRRTGRRAEGLR